MAKAAAARTAIRSGVSARNSTSPTPTEQPADRSLQRYGPFDYAFPPAADNRALFATAVEPQVRRVAADGAMTSVFCYGHTGSGKTHTTIGYPPEPGMVSLAAETLFTELAAADAGAAGAEARLVVVRMAEVYNDRVFDLLAGWDGQSASIIDSTGAKRQKPRELQVRTDEHDNVQFRAAAQLDKATGQVWTSGLSAVRCTSAADVTAALAAGTARRATGSSNLHQQSSRSHAFLEMAVVSPVLLGLVDDERRTAAELTPVAKSRDGALMAYQSQKYLRDPVTGSYTTVPDTEIAETVNALKAAEAAVAPYQEAADSAAAAVRAAVRCGASQRPVGGAAVFVDLAGSECERLVQRGSGAGPRQSAAELKEARQINTSLLALKECIRALRQRKAAAGEAPRDNGGEQAGGGHVPFRNSTLTKALKNFLVRPGGAPGADGSMGPREERDVLTLMVANVCPSEEQLLLTHSTLAYAFMMGGQ